MSKHDIVSLSLKTAGIYCIISAINYSGFSIISFYSSDNFLMTLTSVAPMALFLLFGLYLIFSKKLPDRFTHGISQEEKGSSINSREIQNLAFSIIGVWLIAITIPNLISTITSMLTFQSEPDPAFSSKFWSSMPAHIMKIAAKLGIGSYLFFGSKGLSEIWHKIQQTKGMPSGSSME